MKHPLAITPAAAPRWLASLGLALLLSAAPVWAQDFNQRLLTAQQAAASGAGAAYDQSLNAYLPPAVHACINLTPNRADLKNFSLVADVSASGKIHNIAVSPPTGLAQCFADQFGQNTLPAPPTNASAQGWPIFSTITLE